MNIAGLAMIVENSPMFENMRKQSRKQGKSVVELAEAVLESMDGTHRTREIALSKNGWMTVIEYFGAFPHCRFKWKSSEDGFLLNNQVFDTMFDGVEKIMTFLNDEDATILWNWYVENNE